jgi:hypothetical protein
MKNEITWEDQTLAASADTTDPRDETAAKLLNKTCTLGPRNTVGITRDSSNPQKQMKFKVNSTK